VGWYTSASTTMMAVNKGRGIKGSVSCCQGGTGAFIEKELSVVAVADKGGLRDGPRLDGRHGHVQNRSQ
jgi:hypothetical protein